LPTIRLTQAVVEKKSAPPVGRLVYWDRHLPGFGLRVTAKGAKSWVAMYRVNGKAVLETIGTTVKIPKVEDARKRARESMEKAAAGENPVKERKAAAKRQTANTVNLAVDRYLIQCDRDLKPKTAREWRRIFEHDVLQRWGERPVSVITKGDVLELLNDKATSRERRRQGANGGATVQANRTLMRLRTFFRWCIANDLIVADPTAGVRKPTRETPRDRVLSDDEIRAFWQGTETLDHGPARRTPGADKAPTLDRQRPALFGPLFRLLLLTAQRESEVAGIRWSEIDADKRLWTIPAARSKNGKPHIVHLNELAVEALGQMARIVGQDLVFSATGKTPASGFSHAKARLDAPMLAAERERLRAAGRTREADELMLQPFTLHDLRRTATTGMARLGIPPHIADRILNHQAGTIRGVAAVYNRFEYLEERKAALEAWGRHVEALVRLLPSNVVPLALAR